ncbi:MAG: bifunctional 4-hydroxy-2-oxoglutarate aldolase/2-dehydro-3-deoxy-phosphogluconate aldolase [Lentisphaeria bacterium]|nr:bifunctional 4-hydroxy-2-oxoglutarate aldolase/2-dehydro-3-deoxy-phosphogluconate aldolase [Lentisphaeria bacterium]
MGTFNHHLFTTFPVVGILRGFSHELTVEIAGVAADSGLACLEVTMNSPGACASIRAILEDCGDRMNVGAGTVCSLDDLDRALAAGAQFVVSPITDTEMIRRCVALSVPVFPGAMTPTEIHQAWTAGATMVKVFPAGTLGPKHIKGVKAPLDGVKLLPTGGVSLENAHEFLQAGADGLGVGSPLFDEKRMLARDWNWLREQIAGFRALFAQT